MSTTDDDNSEVGLGWDLSQPPGGIPRSGLGATVMQGLSTPPPAAIPVSHRVPGYIGTDGQFVPLLPGVSPGAFAAQQSNVWQNAAAGYGAETLAMYHQLANIFHRLGSAVADRDPSELIGHPPTDPNEDLNNALYDNSRAARFGSGLADAVNTLPVDMIGAQAISPVAGLIKGGGLAQNVARAGIEGLGGGVLAGAAEPANSVGERPGNAAKAGAGRSAYEALFDLWKEGKLGIPY